MATALSPPRTGIETSSTVTAGRSSHDDGRRLGHARDHGDHPDIRVRTEHAAKRRSHRGVVVHHEHGDGRWRRGGRAIL